MANGFRRNKYNVSRKEDRTVDGIVFASKKEAKRYGELKLLELTGAIRDLRLQPKFPCVVNGVKVCDYIADFWYVDSETGHAVVEDAKGMKTPVYKLKAKLVEAVHGFEITEV